MPTLRVVFPLRLHMLSSAPSELPKERAGAVQGLQNCIIVMSELHGRIASQVVLPKSLWLCDICLSPCSSALHILQPMFKCLHEAAVPFKPGCPMLKTHKAPLSNNLFCFQLMRIDAYPRLCSLGALLLSMASFDYSLPCARSTSK